MNWDAISSIAEIVGAIAVAVSIIYLAQQVKQSNRTTEAATTLEVSRLIAEWHGRLNQTPELAHILIQGTKYDSDFSDQDRARFLVTIAELFLLFEAMHQQCKLGFLTDDAWIPLERGLARLISSAPIRVWWDSEISFNSEAFRTYVAEVRAKYSENDWAERMNKLI